MHNAYHEQTNAGRIIPMVLSKNGEHSQVSRETRRCNSTSLQQTVSPCIDVIKYK